MQLDNLSIPMAWQQTSPAKVDRQGANHREKHGWPGSESSCPLCSLPPISGTLTAHHRFASLVPFALRDSIAPQLRAHRFMNLPEPLSAPAVWAHPPVHLTEAGQSASDGALERETANGAKITNGTATCTSTRLRDFSPPCTPPSQSITLSRHSSHSPLRAPIPAGPAPRPIPASSQPTAKAQPRRPEPRPR